jgi:hypothetical protein
MREVQGSIGPGALIEDAASSVRRFWRNRRVTLVTHRVTTSTRLLAEELTECGATVVAALVGAPSLTDTLPGVALRSMAAAGTAVERRDFDAWLRNPPPAVAAWVDSVDPERSCTVVGSIWTEVDSVCGRPVHGWRRPEWTRWEDKTRIEELWHAVGVPSPAHVVLDPTDPALREQAARLDTGRGVVLARDSTSGIQGAGGALRWVRDPDELETALEEFSALTRRLRIAEFVAGVPCSTQALATDGGIAVFDPAEEVMLRSARTGALVYCGTSTWWRPGPDVRAEIEPYVRRAGRHLMAHGGFRGIFTVDGLLTPGGFRATELNPRAGGGLGLRPGLPDFPVYLFHRAVQERVPGVRALDPYLLEEAFRDAIRRRPSYSGTLALGPLARVEPGEHAFTATAGEVVRYRVATDAADILQVRPTRSDGLIGPAIAELAAALGHLGLVPCTDDAIRGTLRATPAGENA